MTTPVIVFPVPRTGGKHRVFTPAQVKARGQFSVRMSHRSKRHGANWRQIWVDYGGLCARCFTTEHLEFHEPFGEEGASNGWGRLQSRVLLCYRCHCAEHPQLSGEPQRASSSTLNEDVQIEIWMYGGWDKWIAHFSLQDTFGRLLIL